MPLGKVHPRIKGEDGAVCFLLDDTILDSVAPLEGFFEDRAKITIPGESPPAFTDVPIEEVAMEKAAPLGPLKEPTAPQVPHEEQMKLELPQIHSLVGGKCCTPLGHLLPLDKPLQPSVS